MIPAGRKIRRAILHYPTGSMEFVRSPAGGIYYFCEYDGRYHEGIPSRWVFEKSFYELYEKARNCGYKSEVWYEV